MKMTEKMKQSLMEGLKEKGVELSDEDLDEVAGGRDMTQRESLGFSTIADHVTDKRERYICEIYQRYIESLPEGSPEVLFSAFLTNFTIQLTCDRCGATVAAPLYRCGDYIPCSKCRASIKVKMDF